MKSFATAPGRIAVADLGLLALLTAAGGVLRFYHLGEKSLWYDDAVMYHMVQGGWREIVALNAHINSGPPLYPLLLGWLTGPDASEALLRAPGAVFSVLAIPLTWLLAREFLPSRPALLVPLLVALSKTQIAYAQALREYSLTVCVAALIGIACVRFIRDPGSRRAVWLAAAAVLGIATQYGLGILLAGLNVVVVALLWRSGRPWRAYVQWALAQVPAAVLALVIVLVIVPGQMAVVSVAKDGYLASFYWNGTGTGLLRLVSAPENDLIAFAFPGTAMLLLAVLGAVASLAGRGSGLALAFFAAPTALTILLAMAGLYPYGGIRQDIFLTGMVYVLAAVGLAALVAPLAASRWQGGPWAARVLTAVTVVALAIPGLQESLGYVRWQGGRQPMRTLTDTLARRVQPGDVIYVYDGAVPAFGYYWRHRPEPWIRGATHQSYLSERLAAGQMPEVQSEVLRLMRRGAPFWVVITHIMGPDAVELWEFMERSATVDVQAGIPGTWLLRVTPRVSPAGS